MATTYKALAMAQELVSELNLRGTGGLAVALNYDTDGSPLVRVGSGTAGQKGGLYKIMPWPQPLAKDILNLDAQVFTPHIVRLNVEANYAGSTDSVADVNDWATQLLLVSTAVTKGTRTEVFLSSNGTGPNATDINDLTKRVAVYDPNPQFPLVSSQ